MTIKNFGGRKFVLSFFILICALVLIIINRITSADYLKIVFAIMTVYAGLNTFTKFTTAKTPSHD